MPSVYNCFTLDYSITLPLQVFGWASGADNLQLPGPYSVIAANHLTV